MAPRRPLARIAIATTLAFTVTACGGTTPGTDPGATQPIVAPSGAAVLPTVDASSATGSAGSSAAPSAGTSVAPSTSIEPIGSPSVSAAAGSWRTVVPPLAVPAAYLDFGFAGNGDLLVVGTDLITDPKLALWIARYAPDGARLSKKAVDRRIGLINADWIDIDPTDDTVVFSERASDGTFTLRRVSSATGKTVASVNLHDAVLRIAVDVDGRIFGVSPYYTTRSARRPCIVERVGANGGIADGVDHWLKPCESVWTETGPPYFEDPLNIEVARSGHLVLVDENEPGTARTDGTKGLGVIVLTPAWEFTRSWRLPLEWRQADPAYDVVVSSFILAAGTDGQVYLGETLAADDGSRSIGNRIRHFSASGQLLETLGMGGDQAGITWPSHPVVDDTDRLWVIDLDISTRSYSIKVRA